MAKNNNGTKKVPCGMCYRCETKRSCPNKIVLDSRPSQLSLVDSLEMNSEMESTQDNNFGFHFFSVVN